MQVNKISNFKYLYIFLFSFSLLLFLITIFTTKIFGSELALEQILLVLIAPIAPLSEISEDFKNHIIRRSYQLSIWLIVLSSLYTLLILKMKNKYILKFIKLFTIFQLSFAIVYVANFYQIFSFAQTAFEDSLFIENNYHADVDNIIWNKKQNLVLIVAESIETTFTNKDLFSSSLLPNLELLQKQNIYFNNHIQTAGSSWTIAGITSYFFGVPLKLPSYMRANSLSDFSQNFLPNSVTIFQPIEEAGYSIDFFTNWDTNISGYSNLIKDHSKGTNFDTNYYQNTLYYNDKAKYSDSFILERAFEHIENKVQYKDMPFAIIISNIDTHTPIDTNGIMQFDKEVAQFIKNIEKLDKDNTTIIVVGDHLLMQSEIDGISLDQRTIFNLFINPAKTPMQHTENRILSSVDIAPSILEAIGAELPQNQFGLGISLFSDRKTLMEKDSGLYEQEIPKNSDFYNSFF